MCLPRSERCRRTRGVVVFRSELADDVVTRRGIPVTSLVRTAADLARRAGSLAEAVAALDRVLRIDAELPSTLAEWLDARRSWRGVTLARHALGLARAGTESPRETLLRLVWMLDAALPPPLVNPWLTDVRGNVIARPDLFDPVSAVVAEYDGSHHAGSTRRSRDHRRRETLERLGITVVQCTADDLGRAGRERTVGRLRSAHAAGMSRDRRQDRWAIAGLGRPD